MGRPREISPEERAELIRQGYRPIEIWVPDTTSKAYRQEAARQARAAVEADRQAGILELVDEDAHRDWDKA
ncbi:Hypothetical protein RG1141_CH27100 [Neorhizobium galegae bv. officinalis bv. officinalis str. HAMBI 1141]|uniref:Antitoxin MazE n=2 Tax=Neorhizobium galegae bv. officinalis TaxID=323656 RepID=A0A0T7GPF6_NEOGA|nr:antitoxin MazE-like protein [Neorhizobium galegae]MCQ1851072.1 antitoxin MazE family protein [Neorhizobium galegae]CDN55047.1 Hypothetical protein RG1141_CH27100 [Neorhizobium galegae bv. officinalis bv. officinalis str. HAMBI 1141]CDZ49175.1 Hypothetical protein NGAL_HAMBI1189_28010 [Neorhizobium galegae bv. officinalis]